jgi:hypothetical protein
MASAAAATAAAKGTASAPKVSQGPPKSFAEAFAPLAHHLFPDGLPSHITDSTGRRYLNNAWPTRADRSPIKPEAARESIKTLRPFVRGHGGLNLAQIFVVAVAACSTLPTVGRGTGTSLVDGTSKAYVDIIRCIIPSPTTENDDARSKQQENEERIPAQVISMLLSATAASGRCDGRGRAATLRFLTLAVRSGCLRRTIIVGADPRGPRETLLSLYPVIFGMLTDAETVNDAVRLLHAITRRKQAVPHRAQRVRSLYDQASARSRKATDSSGANTVKGSKSNDANKGSSNKMGGFSSLLLLLELYARYDPVGCGRYFPSGTRLGSNLTQYFKVPDDEWEREFAGKMTLEAEAFSLEPKPESSALEDHSLKRDSSKVIGLKRRHPDAKSADERGNQSNEEDKMKQLILKYGISVKMVQESSKKRSKINFEQPGEYDMGKSLSATIDRLEDAFDGVHSASWELLRGRWSDGNGRRGSRRGNRAVRASDLLFDSNICHLILLSSGMETISSVSITTGTGTSKSSTSRNTLCDSEVVRLRVCLPHMLYEEYYDDISSSDHEQDEDGYSDVDDSSDEEDDVSARNGKLSGKMRVLRALASLARHTDMLPPEAENFILDEILPSWDGGDKAGLIICNDLVPVLAPMSFRDIKRRVLVHLGKLYVCGSPRIKFAVVSGALASLVRRWGRLEWSPPAIKGRGTGPATTNDLEYKQRSLQELIQWIDNLLLGGLISEGSSDGSGHELVRLSALDFYNAVCDICDQCSLVASPSPALIYRLFLSSTAVCVDRACALLLRYKSVFEKMKALTDRERGKEIPGLEKVAIFNCFIWDACSVLWRCSPLPPLDEGQANDMARMNSILFTDIPKETLLALHYLPSDFNVAAALSITHGAVFAGHASDFLTNYYRRKRERGASTDDIPAALSPDLLTGSVKVKYLDSLRDEGYTGLHAFLTTFVGSLAERERKKARKRAEKELQARSSGTS